MKEILELISKMSLDMQWQTWQELSEMVHEQAEKAFDKFVETVR